jgi:anti-sigma B factor antagonist
MDLLQVGTENGITVVAPQVARLDASVAPAFKQQVQEVVAAGASRVVVDLQAVDFVDSSGLGAMVSILKALGTQGGMAVCNAKGPVRALFELTRMDKVFAILPDREQALARLAR